MSNKHHPPLIHLHYHRPPDQKQIYQQYLIAEEAGAHVTLSIDLTIETPARIQNQTVLETGSKIIWFTFPNTWHDIGLFHRPDGTFTGIYANIITPIKQLSPFVWETTDLFLDVWINSKKEIFVLDEDEFTQAKSNKWISSTTASNAISESKFLTDGYLDGTWPPPFIFEWNLARALQLLQ